MIRENLKYSIRGKKIKINCVGVTENLKKIKEQIGNNSVKIIAVTKYASEEQIHEAYKSGILDFGESYVQDALLKMPIYENHKSIQWHFIGRLQKNKVKYVVNRFYLIQSVDSIELAELINQTANKRGCIQNILLQANTSQEVSKGGFSPDELKKQFDKLTKLSNTKILGLMTIAPKTDDTSMIKNCFSMLKELKESISLKYMINLKELSMGMSADYKTAIACGSTMIRLGRAIFQN